MLLTYSIHIWRVYVLNVSNQSNNGICVSDGTRSWVSYGNPICAQFDPCSCENLRCYMPLTYSIGIWLAYVLNVSNPSNNAICVSDGTRSWVSYGNPICAQFDPCSCVAGFGSIRTLYDFHMPKNSFTEI